MTAAWVVTVPPRAGSRRPARAPSPTPRSRAIPRPCPFGTSTEAGRGRPGPAGPRVRRGAARSWARNARPSSRPPGSAGRGGAAHGPAVAGAGRERDGDPAAGLEGDAVVGVGQGLLVLDRGLEPGGVRRVDGGRVGRDRRQPCRSEARRPRRAAASATPASGASSGGRRCGTGPRNRRRPDPGRPRRRAARARRAARWPSGRSPHGAAAGTGDGGMRSANGDPPAILPVAAATAPVASTATSRPAVADFLWESSTRRSSATTPTMVPVRCRYGGVRVRSRGASPSRRQGVEIADAWTGIARRAVGSARAT